MLSVEHREDGDIVQVAYGTPQKLNRLQTGEVAITQSHHPAAYVLAGLSYDIKFAFNAIVELQWTPRYFKPPPKSRYGNNPSFGTLHATVLRSVEFAFRAAMARRGLAAVTRFNALNIARRPGNARAVLV